MQGILIFLSFILELNIHTLQNLKYISEMGKLRDG